MLRQWRFEFLILKVWKLNTFLKYMNIYMHNFHFKTPFEGFQKFLTCSFFFFLGSGVFFFLFFFFLEKFKVTHSLIWKVCFFFSGDGKKKTAFLLTHSIFYQKCQKTNFSGKKKTVPLFSKKTVFVFILKTC